MESFKTSEAGVKTKICSKCGKPTPSRKDTCDHCGAHLYLICKHCGQVNDRALAKCTKCGTRLHRTNKSGWQKLVSRIDRLKIIQGVLLVVAIIFLYYYIQRVTNQAVQPSPPPVEQ